VLQRDRFVAPRYPPAAQAGGVTGWVDVKFTVSSDGSVKDAVVIEAQPPGTFDAAALAAVARWHYRPAPMERHAHLRLRFDLGR
jgi:protein TonB